MRKNPDIGIREMKNSVSLFTDYGSVTAILDKDGDVLLSTSSDPKPVLTIPQLKQFTGAVLALHAEQTLKEKDQ